MWYVATQNASPPFSLSVAVTRTLCLRFASFHVSKGGRPRGSGSVAAVATWPARRLSDRHARTTKFGFASLARRSRGGSAMVSAMRQASTPRTSYLPLGQATATPM